MKILKDILKQANIVPDLKLFTKREGGGTQTTGPHIVKLIDSKIIKGSEYLTNKEVYIVRLLLEENGEQKKYEFPVKNQKGDVHYLVHRLAEFKEGSEIVLEGKSEGGRSFTSVSSVGDAVESSKENVQTIEQDDIPVIKDTEDAVENKEEKKGEIDVDNLNF